MAQAAHLELGAAGEELAARHLISLGWEIVGRNVRMGRGELDIVARDGEDMVIVEVRTRTLGKITPAEMTVGHIKIRKLLRAAKRFIESIGYDGCWRIDVAAVTIEDDGSHSIELFRDATMGMEADRL